MQGCKLQLSRHYGRRKTTCVTEVVSIFFRKANELLLFHMYLQFSLQSCKISESCRNSYTYSIEFSNVIFMIKIVAIRENDKLLGLRY